jgi:hypothetical protein
MIEVLTGVLVLVTAFYSWATFRILRANESVVAAMREQTEATYRPYITVVLFLEPDNPIFYLKVANTGKTAAVSLTLKIDRSFLKFGEADRDLASFSAFNSPIESFSPGAELIFGLAQGFVVFAEGADPATCPAVFAVTASYGFGSRSVEERHAIDLRPYLNSDVPQNAVIRKLRAITEAIAKLADAVKATNRQP